MSFSIFSWPWVLGGLLALAASLYFLQQLRVRYRTVVVASTLLWRQAAQQAPARKLRERFRYPLAYLLILAILSLIWIALAGPTGNRSGTEVFHVLVLDGSAGMAREGRFKDAVSDLKKAVSALPADRRQVLWSGASMSTLLAPGEDEALLDYRLRSLGPESAPSNMDHVISQLAARGQRSRSTRITLFGQAPVSAAVVAGLPANIAVVRAKALEAREKNQGIVALGTADAASGAWDRVDVFVRVGSNQEEMLSASDLEIDIDGRPVEANPVAVREGWILPDMPAHGGLISVRLARSDALSMDNIASLRLPTKPFIPVQVSPSLRALMEPVLSADPAVRIVESGASVVIRSAGEAFGQSLPALEFVPSSRQQSAFLITTPVQGDQLGEAVDALGLRQIDATALATVAARPVEVSLQVGSVWKVSVWEELLGSRYNFTRSREFPLFVASTLRWLTHAPANYAIVAAGRPLLSDGTTEGEPVIDGLGRNIAPPGVPFTPQQAGQLNLGKGRNSLAVSLLDPVLTSNVLASDADLEVDGKMESAWHISWSILLLFLALLLIAAEWHWHRRGMVP
ncbi:BatA domain-containing protein [Pseudoxanthomonas putridarboris]|uniref:BatA domain-containing protein n=1 Tax=Pseudoxanthomonas putridarboris TaxID=752605 RepID=A0ABU9IVR4_9GAMM